MTNKWDQLVDIHDIKTLKYKYSYGANIIDGKADKIKEFCALFADDARFDVGMGVATGPAEIQVMMESLTTQWHCAMHYMLNPVIELDGDTASATVTGLFAFVSEPGTAPVWLCNIYNDTFVRTPGGWRFQSVKVAATTFADPAFLAGYADHLD